MGAFDDLIPTSSQPAMSNAPRVGYIPGAPKKPNPPEGYRYSSDGTTLETIPGGPKDPNNKTAKEPPSGYRYAADGVTLEAIPGGPASKSGAGTETEAKSAMFLRRMLGSNSDYDTLNAGPRGATNQTVHGLPGGEFMLRNLPEGMGGDSVTRKAADRDINDYIGASLRYESGASINADEFAKQDKIFFPHSGDEDPALQERYRQARIRAIEGMAASTGRAMTPDLQAALDKWRASVAAQPPATAGNGEQMDRGNRMTVANGPDGMAISNGAHDGTDPRFAGANDKVQAMLHSGASDKQILGYMNGLGFSTKDMVSMASQLRKIREFQQGNPQYNGKYDVDLERMTLPDDATNKIASSPLGAYGIAAADTLTGGHLDNLVGMGGGNAELANLGIQSSRANNWKASLAGDLTGGALLAGAGAGLGVAGEAGALAPRALAADAATGAYVSSGQGGTQLIDPQNAVKGALVGSVAGAAGRGVTNTVASAVSPTGGALAPLLEAGVRPTLGQRMGGIANRAEQAFTSIPAVGGIQRSARSAAIDEMQTGAFNKALNEIDTELPRGIKKGTQAHAFAQNAFNQVYDKARAGMQFGLDQDFAKDAAAITQDASLLTRDSQGVLKKIADDVGNKLRASGGVLNGDQYKIVQERIGKKIAALRKNPNGDGELADILGDFQTAIDNAARRQSPKAASDLLDKADRGYAKMVIIENAARARGGEPGEFSGVGLDRAVQTTNSSRRSRAYLRGEANMQDYATAARRLGDNVADSGSAERLLTNGGMALTAHSVSPLFAIPWAVDTAATLPGVRQVLGSLMTPSANAAKRAAANKVRLAAGTIGSLLAAPASAEATGRR
jgi:hypothetical protein